MTRGVLLLAAAALIAGCGGGSKAAQTTTGATTLMTTNPTGTSATAHFRYSKQLEQSYLRACTNGGQVKESVCRCTLSKLSESVSARDLQRIRLSGVIPRRVRAAITRAANECASG